MSLQVLLVLLCALSTTQSKVIGGPQILCTTNGVVIRLPMDEPFRGHIFIRGHYGDEQCHVDYRGKNETEPAIEISFDDCGMRRRRQTNPRGLSISSTLIVSFHPTFITYEDRAYQIECFYMEESRIVQSEFNVSPLQATEMILQPEMPVCEYTVLSGGPEGDTIASLNLGDTIYHRWSCDYQKDGFYCMRLHTCTADDGQGNLQPIIDTNGCSLDDGIFPQIQYTGDLTAGVLSKAFKFADHSNIFFQCQIALTLKEKHDNGKCPRSVCPQSRKRRSLQFVEQTFDVAAAPVFVNEFVDVKYANSGESIDDSNGSCRVIRNMLACMIAVSVASICGCLCSIVSYLFWRRSEHIHKTSFLS
uniref:ZP domain-containing protein n=2 Tax=Parascaris TaxID=6254 RepID=A0A915BY85_PARUN